jgi:cytochrome c-type protein NapC
MNGTLAIQSLIALLATTAVLVVVLIRRPSLAAARGGRVLAFVGFFLLPAACLWAGLSLHMETSKTTEFCLSCHVMEPYGQSLWVDDGSALPAAHFQNRRIDRDHACFTCHTQYTMFGDYKAKLTGLKHLWVQYFGEIPEKLELYRPYQNRECLHCHAGARAYEEMHEDDLADLAANEISCLDCHEVAHGVADLEGTDRWSPLSTTEDPQ